MQDVQNCHAIEYFNNLELGLIDSPITPMVPGRVKYEGSIWPAQFNCASGKTMEPGERVVVVGRAGITLLVMPESECLFCHEEGRTCGRQCLRRIYSLNLEDLGIQNSDML